MSLYELAKLRFDNIVLGMIEPRRISREGPRTLVGYVSRFGLCNEKGARDGPLIWFQGGGELNRALPGSQFL